jgi:hypothetical protein
MLEIEETLMLVLRHQGNPNFHPFTCGGCRGTTQHREGILVPIIDEESNCTKLYFGCSFNGCPYIQEITKDMIMQMKKVERNIGWMVPVTKQKDEDEEEQDADKR